MWFQKNLRKHVDLFSREMLSDRLWEAGGGPRTTSSGPRQIKSQGQGLQLL